MRIAPLADVKARLSAYLDECGIEGPVVITRNGKAAAPRWMRAYGALQHLRHERKAIERAIESEFEKIEPEDRL